MSFTSGSSDGNVYALDAATWEELWQFTTGGSVLSSPAVANGVVYVGSSDGNVYAIGSLPGKTMNILNLHNTTYDQTTITWNWTDPLSSDFDHVQVYLDGVLRSDVIKGIQTYTATGLSPSTKHTIGMRIMGTNGLINQTWVNSTATTAPQQPVPVHPAAAG